MNFFSAEQRELGLNDFMDKHSPETRQWWEKTVSKLLLIECHQLKIGADDVVRSQDVRTCDDRFRSNGSAGFVVDATYRRR